MSDIQKQLATLEQKIVDFQGDALPAAKAENQKIYVPIRPICEYLGLDFASQSRRLNRDDILSEVRQMITIKTDSGDQLMVSLPIEFLNGWLFGVQSNRVKMELREKIREYKFSCYYALADAFSPQTRGPYDGPSIGLGLTLRLIDDFNDLKTSVTDQQLVIQSEQQGIRQMISQLQAEVKRLKTKVDEPNSED